LLIPSSKAIDASKTELEINLLNKQFSKVTGEKNLLIFPDTKANMINGFG
jgi:hypothetical protein